jgi:serine/threonine protein kinase
MYRDLKPDNIVISKDGHAMLTDFGLAKQNIQTIDLHKSFLGSPIYIAPEII